MLFVSRIGLLGSSKCGLQVATNRLTSGKLGQASATSRSSSSTVSGFYRIHSPFNLLQFSCFISQVILHCQGQSVCSQGRAVYVQQSTCPISQSDSHCIKTFCRSSYTPTQAAANKNRKFPSMADEGSETVTQPATAAGFPFPGKDMEENDSNSPLKTVSQEEVEDGFVLVKKEKGEKDDEQSAEHITAAGRITEAEAERGGLAENVSEAAESREPAAAVQPGDSLVLDGETAKAQGDSQKLPWRKAEEGEHLFKLMDTCILALNRGDITKWAVDGETDAIVNAANERMLGGGGVDGAIHRAAGPKLYSMCREFPEVERGVRCPTGEARSTGAARLRVKYVIHTVGPIYHRKRKDDCAQLLYNAYMNSLKEANRLGVHYVCFPAISCGVYGYPYDEAARIALKAVQENAGNVKEVHFMLFEMDVWHEWLANARHAFEPISDD